MHSMPGIKTNLLYWATTTPNVGLEWRLAPRYTLSATVGYNAFNFPNHTDANGVAVNPKLHHWLVMPEAKYWFCRVFERHYIGFHALYGQYNAGGMKFPKFLEDARYDGWAAGAGLSYGYQWALGKRWGLEASIRRGLYLPALLQIRLRSLRRQQGNYGPALVRAYESRGIIHYYIR